jgi:hypothetical protein
VSVWDAIDANPVGQITQTTLQKFFPTNPPRFWDVPYGCHDAAVFDAMLRDAGFTDIRCERVAKEGESPSALDAATGLIEGTPVYAEIVQRRPEAVAEIEATLAGNLARELGDRPLRSPLRALVATARRP